MIVPDPIACDAMKIIMQERTVILVPLILELAFAFTEVAKSFTDLTSTVSNIASYSVFLIDSSKLATLLS